MIAALALYVFAGTAFAWPRRLDIALDAVDDGPVLAALRWVLTWPLWAFQR